MVASETINLLRQKILKILGLLILIKLFLAKCRNSANENSDAKCFTNSKVIYL